MRSVSLGEHRGAEKRAQFALQRTGSRGSRSVCLCAYSAFRFPHSALFCGTTPSKCARTARTHSFFMRPKGALHTPEACFMRHRRASFAAQSAAIPFSIAYLSLN